MTTNNTGAVFFLGTRAHYQVLQQPESQYDVENGNASTETIYTNSNPSMPELWPDRDDNDLGVNVNEEKTKPGFGTCVKKRNRSRSSETVLCERDSEMKPALLNRIEDSEFKPKPKRHFSPVLRLMTWLSRRKQRLPQEYMKELQHSLAVCTYRESCRCLDCQSRYFECDESDEYSSDDSELSRFVAQLEAPAARAVTVSVQDDDGDDDDEVFIDNPPGDTTSTDLLIEGPQKMSVSSDEVTSTTEEQIENMELEVAAGTPVLLNYLLTHPITCCIQ